MKTAYDGIRAHQKALYPDGIWDGVHVQIKVEHGGRAGWWVSATVPRVEKVDWPLVEGRKGRLYEYNWPLPQIGIDALVKYANAQIGKKYDTLQLVGIAIHQQKWVPKFMRSWLGHRMQLPGMKEVCSTLAHKAHLAAFDASQFLPGPGARPLGDRDPFDACPADFENHKRTFHLVAEVNT